MLLRVILQNIPLTKISDLSMWRNLSLVFRAQEEELVRNDTLVRALTHNKVFFGGGSPEVRTYIKPSSLFE
tara:strand:+ start:373 stop:585 length:213 start_codon:yes stop_codon:yes gene_type:complete